MTIYQCKICLKYFNKKSHLDDHLNKKIPCQTPKTESSKINHNSSISVPNLTKLLEDFLKNKKINIIEDDDVEEEDSDDDES